jgi:hypothetical protein
MRENYVKNNIEYHQDIKFLLNRMEMLLVREEYERMAVLKKWVLELIEYHHKNELKK